MSTTALVRSSSSSNSLISPPAAQNKSVSPASGASLSSLPKAQLTPQRLPDALAQKPTPPSKQSPSKQQPDSPANSTPGRWRHPRMDEVIRRQNRTNFDKSNTLAVLYNVACLVITFVASWLQSTFLPTHMQRTAQPYTFYIYLISRAFLLANTGIALAPLFRKQDACEDVPLTSHQRQLLGLPPMSRPATPQEQAQYVTPPRLSRSATPASGTSSLFVQHSGSPLSGRGSPLNENNEARRSVSNSPFSPASQPQRRASGSPYAPSPLAGTTGALRNGLGAERRRLSYTSTRSSPLSTSEFDAIGANSGGANTPTKGHRASVGLNSKWLYEKGRASSNAWGTGSVFS